MSNTHTPFDPSILGKSLIADFYSDFGIKQGHSFSGGFRFINKSKPYGEKNKKPIEEKDLYKEFGISKTSKESYKLNHNEVPDTKE